MTFYSPSDSKFTRHYREEVEMVFSGIDCVLNGELAIYCSNELTTGRRLYDILREHGLKTASELKKKMGQPWFETNIFGANADSAKEFAKSVRSSLSDDPMIITPAPFTAPGWSQPEYLAFWETLIRTRVKAVWFNENWEFSNGCTFEFAVALDAGVPTFDHLGSALSRQKAIQSVEKAIHRLTEEEFDTSKLRENLDRLRAAHVHPEKEPAAHLFSEKSGSYLSS
jgi:hypothetical protein